MSPLQRSARYVALVLLTAGVELLATDFTSGGLPVRGGATLPGWILAALTVLICALLPLGRRYPMQVFAAQWAYAVATLMVPTFFHFAGILVALYAVARRAPRRSALITLLSCAVPFGANALSVADYSHLPVRTAAQFWGAVTTIAALWAVVVFAAWLLGRLSYAADQRAALELQLHAAHAAEALRAQRLALARELHDIVANAVGVIILTASGTRQSVPPEDPRQAHALEVIEAAGQQAARDLDRLLGLLRASDDKPEPGAPAYGEQRGLQDLPALISLARRSGLDVDLLTEGKGSALDTGVSLAAYRTVQEALTNATKYAGRDARVRVQLNWSASQLTVAVRSHPMSSQRTQAHVPSSGQGLVGLAERVKLVDGTLHVGALEDGGFLVRASLPVTPLPASTSGPVPPGDSA